MFSLRRLTVTISMYESSVPRFANILRHNGLEIGKRDYIGNP